MSHDYVHSLGLVYLDVTWSSIWKSTWLSLAEEQNRNQYPSFVNSVIMNNWWYYLQQNFTHTSSSDCSKGQGHIHGTWWWRPLYRWSSKGVHRPLYPPVKFKSHDSQRLLIMKFTYSLGSISIYSFKITVDLSIFYVMQQNLPMLGVSRTNKQTTGTLQTVRYLFWFGGLSRLVTTFDWDSILCCCLIQLVLFHYLSKVLIITN